MLQQVCKETFPVEDFQPVISALVSILKGSSSVEVLQHCLSEFESWASHDNLASRQKYLCTITAPLIELLSKADLRFEKRDQKSIFYSFYKSLFVVFTSVLQAGQCPDLLIKIQVAYHQLARSSSRDLKLRAIQMAQAAALNNVDCLGHDLYVGEFKCPIFDHSEAILYYNQCLLEYLSAEHQVSAVLWLICDFASETYRKGQLIDFFDRQFRWCAAEITEIDRDHRMKIHYTASDSIYDEWIVSSHNIAPAFTFTKIEIHPKIYPEHYLARWGLLSVRFYEVDSLMDCQLLGLTSREVTTKIFVYLGCDFQDAINYARWANRDNLQTLV
eukprot:TRINITY_DN4893_c0_g1_i1.p1 TRINITY_DN4893_c0_g1~~TRINITY_DN4893_c0_g1_i1.p1  ORF type:complete len:330 (-),score=55.72 TRINITY_DN4893_c0_g1_i1:123-1112(-)